MGARVIAAATERTWVVVPEQGADAVGQLQWWVRREGIGAARLTAIGGFERAVVGWFDWEAQDYRRITVDEQVEVVSLIGDVAVTGAEATLHAHVTLGRRDGSAVVGHLLEGVVRPTLEVLLVESQPTCNGSTIRAPGSHCSVRDPDVARREGPARRHRRGVLDVEEQRRAYDCQSAGTMTTGRWARCDTL